MTHMLASVSSVAEAASILTVGPDIIDIKDPCKGALGAVEPDVARAIVKRIAGQTMTSATIGDLPLQAAGIAAAIEKMQGTGVDIIKVGVFAEAMPDEVLRTIEDYVQTGVRIVLVFFADLKPALNDLSPLSALGIYGVMLDTADKSNGSLRTIINDKVLERFVRKARACGLMTGLAGSLKLKDIQPLLKIGPDYLGFRSALCDKQQRRGTIDLHSARAVRAMIPVHAYGAVKEQDLILSMN